jgi:hypothetical protein
MGDFPVPRRRRPNLSLLIGIALAASLGACMTATPYQPYRAELAGGVHGGYSEVQLAPDRYRVRFHGNELAPRDRVEGYMLYRAAELTLQQGYDWFSIIDRHTEHDVQTYVRPDPFYRPWYGPDYGYWRPHWRYYRPGIGWEIWHPEWGGPFWRDRMDVSTVESFEAEAEIVLGRGPVAAGEERTFDARKAIADLEPTIERPKSGLR